MAIISARVGITLWIHGANITDIHCLDKPFLGTRKKEGGVYKEYEWETHRQVRTHIENFGKGLSALGLQRQSSLGVYSINRREWVSARTTFLQH